MNLRTELETVVRHLLAGSAEGSAIALDTIGHALGTLAVSTDEIELVFARLEQEGRSVHAQPGGGAEARLMRVVAAARALKAESSRRPTLGAVAERANLTRDEVVSALYLLRIMQRG